MGEDTEHAAGRHRVGDEIKSMLADRRLDGVVRMLDARYPGNAQLCEDAVLEAIARLIGQVERNDIKNVPAYVKTVASNYMKKELGKRAPLESLEGKLGDENGQWEPEAGLVDVDTPGRLDDQVGRELLAGLKAVTSGWNENIRVVTNLVLDHAFADDYDWMTAEDLAAEASAILGEDVSAATASMWKSRGLQRLRDQFDFDEN